MIDHKYKHGDKVEDSVTGFKGIVVAITEYSIGCIHYGLQADKCKDNRLDDWVWIAEGQLSLVKVSVVKFKVKEKNPSGPCPNAPSL